MSISMEQLLKKIESELHKAKQAGNSSKLRENVHSIKVLCELILEKNESGTISKTQAISEVASAPTLAAIKLEEEEANGDSLLDF